MYKLIISGSIIALLSACVAKPVNPGAERIFVSHEEPPPDCVFVGEVQGSQGNFWTAEFTQDRNILTGARNELRNQAYSLGANYVLVETESHSNNTAGHSLGGTFSSVVIGNAYRCPNGYPETV
jgi:hypothetical protein